MFVEDNSAPRMTNLQKSQIRGTKKGLYGLLRGYKAIILNLISGVDNKEQKKKIGVFKGNSETYTRYYGKF